MTALGDRAGIALVALALLVGVLLAVVVNRFSMTAAPGAPPAATAPSTSAQGGEVDLTHADRQAGRLVFRAQCQECHTEGRQSFDMATRERTALIRTQVRRGSAQMPGFAPDQLSDDQLVNVIAYIAIPSEPEPPDVSPPPVRGVNFDVLEASGAPGQSPSVRFRIRDNAGQAIAPSEMTALNLTVAGPTVDYQWAQREDARRAESLPDGSARYVFRAQLPAEAQGTFAVATEGYLEFPSAVAGVPPARDVGYNTVFYFPVTDPAPVPRRQIVKTENCNACHGTLATHGGTRRNTEFCVMCHNATQSDADKRMAVGGPLPPEPVQFRNFIHRIHTGEDLTRPFVVYGGSPTAPQPVDLAAVHPFPKDRANCALCHVQDSYMISQTLEASAALRVILDGQVVRELPPVTAACTGCHDSPQAFAHAASQTSGGVESCALCHAQGRPYSVTTVHRVSSSP
ncbi:MAG TPA: c-type cytochrome [Chloroflexota bacterium]|nr:c-type cytochrome [Chloroflexota bacterium]